MKQQEKLEEFIKKQLALGKYQDQESAIKHSIELGAKWQQEQQDEKYNEMLEMLKRLIQPDLDISDLIEAEQLIKKATI